MSAASREARLGRTDRWRPTQAHVRAVALAAATVLAAVLWRRPDLLVLACPLAVVVAWSLFDRPRGQPVLRSGLDDHTVREGATTAWRAELTDADGVDLLVAALAPMVWIDRRPRSGVAAVLAGDGAAEAVVALRSTRWGRRTVEQATVVASSRWGAFRWATTTPAAPLTTLPIPDAFDPGATVRPADGLVGLDHSVRKGEGSEFAGIRPFQPGDRLRRINWPRSTRSLSLHVNATWADQDTHVVLVVDAGSEAGVSEGIDGRASSLDTTVRAAGAIARHYARRGDRVSLRVLGTTRVPSVAPASGEAHLQRLVEALSFIRPTSTPRTGRTIDPRLVHTTGHIFAILLSPLLTRDALDAAVSMARHGSTVAVIDTLPSDLGHTDPDTEMAWRIRLLERRRELRIVQELGLPVVRWEGPGSLDRILRDLSRRASAPRVRVR